MPVRIMSPRWREIKCTARPAPDQESDRQGAKGQSNPEPELPVAQGDRNTRRVPWPVIQVNGQRKYGPPEDWEGPPPPKGTEVFVSRLPRESMEDDICPVFASVGEIYELRILMDFAGTNRGYCFVKYSTREMSQRAIRELNNTRIAGNPLPIMVEESLDNCKLFISPVPETYTNEDIVSHLSRCIEGVKSAQVIRCKNTQFCFVEFKNHRLAAMARRALLSSGIRGWTWDLTIDWAVPEGRKVNHDKQKHRLFIQNLTWEETEEEVRYLLDAITVNMRAVKSYHKEGNVGVVDLNSRSVGEYMIAKLNGATYDGELLKVCWANPRRHRSEISGTRSRQETDSSWSTTSCTDDQNDCLIDGSVGSFLDYSELSWPSLPSSPSKSNSGSSSPNNDRYFVPDFKLDKSALFEPNQFPAPSGPPLGWWQVVEEQKAAHNVWMQKEHRALPVPQMNLTHVAMTLLTPPLSDDGQVQYAGGFTSWMPDETTACLRYLQPSDVAGDGLPGDCTVAPSTSQAVESLRSFRNSNLRQIQGVQRKDHYIPPTTNGSRLGHVSNAHLYGLPTRGHQLAQTHAVSHQFRPVPAYAPVAPAIFRRDIKTPGDYKEFSELLASMLKMFPNYCFEILRETVFELDWGKLRADVHTRKIDARVAVTLHLEQPNRELQIWGANVYYTSELRAKNDSARCFALTALLAGPFVFFQDTQHRYGTQN